MSDRGQRYHVVTDKVKSNLYSSSSIMNKTTLRTAQFIPCAPDKAHNHTIGWTHPMWPKNRCVPLRQKCVVSVYKTHTLQARYEQDHQLKKIWKEPRWDTFEAYCPNDLKIWLTTLISPVPFSLASSSSSSLKLRGMMIGADIVANKCSTTFENQLKICSSTHRFYGDDRSLRVLAGQIESSQRILRCVVLCCVVRSLESRFKIHCSVWQ